MKKHAIQSRMVSPRPRRGVATLWLILSLPVFLILFGFLIEGANLWLARIEFKNALDAASLSAVQHWASTADPSDPSDTLPARQVGVSYALANNVTGQPVVITENFRMNCAPNQNDLCSGNLVFGAVDTTDIDNIIFDANERPSCIGGSVFLDVTKAGSSSSTVPRMFGVFFEDGLPNVYIRSIAYTIPVLGMNSSQQPYFSGDPSQQPVVSIFAGSDVLNLNNITPVPLNPPGVGVTTTDIRGLNPSPTTSPGGNPQTQSTWTFPNGNGDIWFTFSDPVPTQANRFRTMTIHFADNTFNAPADPMDPSTYEFVRFGAAVSGLGPPALGGGGTNNNDGDNFGNPDGPVQIAIEFVDNNTGISEICNTAFADTNLLPPTSDGSDNQSTATCGFAGTGREFGVRAQGTISVNSVFSDLFGLNLGTYDITARSDAMYSCENGSARLVHITTFNCVDCPP